MVVAFQKRSKQKATWFNIFFKNRSERYYCTLLRTVRNSFQVGYKYQDITMLQIIFSEEYQVLFSINIKMDITLLPERVPFFFLLVLRIRIPIGLYFAVVWWYCVIN